MAEQILKSSLSYTFNDWISKNQQTFDELPAPEKLNIGNSFFDNAYLPNMADLPEVDQTNVRLQFLRDHNLLQQPNIGDYAYDAFKDIGQGFRNVLPFMGDVSDLAKQTSLEEVNRAIRGQGTGAGRDVGMFLEDNPITTTLAGTGAGALEAYLLGRPIGAKVAGAGLAPSSPFFIPAVSALTGGLVTAGQELQPVLQGKRNPFAAAANVAAQGLTSGLVGGNTFLKRVGIDALGGGLGAGASEAIDQVSRGQFDLGQIGKQALYGAGLGAGIGAALPSGGSNVPQPKRQGRPIGLGGLQESLPKKAKQIPFNEYKKALSRPITETMQKRQFKQALNEQYKQAMQYASKTRLQKLKRGYESLKKQLAENKRYYNTPAYKAVYDMSLKYKKSIDQIETVRQRVGDKIKEAQQARRDAIKQQQVALKEQQRLAQQKLVQELKQARDIQREQNSSRANELKRLKASIKETYKGLDIADREQQRLDKEALKLARQEKQQAVKQAEQLRKEGYGEQSKALRDLKRDILERSKETMDLLREQVRRVKKITKKRVNVAREIVNSFRGETKASDTNANEFMQLLGYTGFKRNGSDSTFYRIGNRVIEVKPNRTISTVIKANNLDTVFTNRIKRLGLEESLIKDFGDDLRLNNLEAGAKYAKQMPLLDEARQVTKTLDEYDAYIEKQGNQQLDDLAKDVLFAKNYEDAANAYGRFLDKANTDGLTALDKYKDVEASVEKHLEDVYKKDTEVINNESNKLASEIDLPEATRKANETLIDNAIEKGQAVNYKARSESSGSRESSSFLDKTDLPIEKGKNENGTFYKVINENGQITMRYVNNEKSGSGIISEARLSDKKFPYSYDYNGEYTSGSRKGETGALRVLDENGNVVPQQKETLIKTSEIESGASGLIREFLTAKSTTQGINKDVIAAKNKLIEAIGNGTLTEKELSAWEKTASNKDIEAMNKMYGCE